MIVYRIAKKKYVHDLSGYGAYLYGGRWNEVGVRTLYCSTSRPLALLELLVHRNGSYLTLSDFVMIELQVSDKHMLDRQEVTKTLLQGGRVSEQQAVARTVFADRDVAGIIVSSAVLTMESNVLLNPDSVHHRSIIVVEEYPIRIDPRLVE